MFFAILAPLVLLLCGLIVPIIIAVLVCQDARKRQGCTPWLWALIAVFTPGFIGVVIYLLVRHDYPLKPEYVARRYEQQYEQRYDRAPGEGYGTSGEGYAPDGENRYREEYDNRAVPTGLPTWAKVVIVVALVLAAIFFLTLALGILQYIPDGKEITEIRI
ncbi:hypothetical protein BHK98_12365 [Hornefia porci]|uniref:Uncharacterized protein n=1 Tax=Hornefia porci TaxID=2652292 RepID=A0A1Q9JKP6_9FIRM|nr:PLDc N-terminal domain-containing protein [Hornefia porci]OLR56788.1 hypothetical protein BHK98_12365 [Hornefia porci]